jgi:hypothetical protein
MRQEEDGKSVFAINESIPSLGIVMSGRDVFETETMSVVFYN